MQVSIDNPTEDLRVSHGSCEYCGTRYLLAVSNKCPCVLYCTYCNRDGHAPRVTMVAVDIHNLGEASLRKINRITLNEEIFV